MQMLRPDVSAGIKHTMEFIDDVAGLSAGLNVQGHQTRRRRVNTRGLDAHDCVRCLLRGSRAIEARGSDVLTTVCCRLLQLLHVLGVLRVGTRLRHMALGLLMLMALLARRTGLTRFWSAGTSSTGLGTCTVSWATPPTTVATPPALVRATTRVTRVGRIGRAI